jgi:leucyl aminopeptidase
MNNLLSPLEHELALMDARAQSAKLTRPVDVEKREEITKQFDKERKTQARKFDRDKSTRLWMAARKFAKDRGEDFDRLRKRKNPSSNAKARRIARMAKRAVAQDHDRRMSQIDLREAKQLNALVETARDRVNGPQSSQPQKRLTDQRDVQVCANFNRTR